MIEVTEETEVTQRVLKSSGRWVCPHCNQSPQKDDGIAYIGMALHYSKGKSIKWTRDKCGKKLECSEEVVTYRITKTLH